MSKILYSLPVYIALMNLFWYKTKDTWGVPIIHEYLQHMSSILWSYGNIYFFDSTYTYIITFVVPLISIHHTLFNIFLTTNFRGIYHCQRFLQNRFNNSIKFWPIKKKLTDWNIIVSKTKLYTAKYKMCVTFLLQPLLRSMKVWTSQEPLWRRKMKGRRKNRSFSRLLYIITLGESHCSPKTWVWAENALSDFICRSDDCKYWILLMYVCTF